jgi:membrane protein implicated in regulation of membrane protease activity
MLDMIDWNIVWWGWVVLGFALALLELATPGGFYFLFFGLGALAVGFLSWTGVIEQPWVQLMLFSVFSIVSSLLFRKPLLERFGPKSTDVPVDSLVGETAMALDDIDVNGFGKVELRGTAWNARNSGENKVNRGQRCTVDRVDGLSLWVKG